MFLFLYCELLIDFMNCEWILLCWISCVVKTCIFERIHTRCFMINSFAIEHRWNVIWKFMCWDVGLWLFLSIEFFILCLNILCKLVCSLVRVVMKCKLVNLKEKTEKYVVCFYMFWFWNNCFADVITPRPSFLLWTC